MEDPPERLGVAEGPSPYITKADRLAAEEAAAEIAEETREDHSPKRQP